MSNPQVERTCQPSEDAEPKPHKQILKRPIDATKYSPPATYPPLPEGYEKHERYYVLGWKVMPSWFASFAQRLCKGNPNADSWLFGMRLLKHRVKYYDFYWMGGLPHDVPIPANPYDPTVDVHQLFAVCTTARSYLFKQRLTQAQYEFMVALWGVPEWYRDYLPKHEFWLMYPHLLKETI
ncbi:hypothetical protein POSPLADRAFT_1173843, partial [Postia placenta MAD-698-R-SB12]